MDYSICRISLDVHSAASQYTIRCKKGDTKRRIVAVLTDGGKPFAISEKDRAVFRGKKPADANGHRGIIYNDAVIKDGAIIYDLKSENTEVSGVVDCEFTLYDSSNKAITSPRFALIVDDGVNTNDEVENVGSNEVTALTALVSETSALKDEIETKLENGEFVGEKGDKGDPADVSTIANAIKGTASGTHVTVDDFSPIVHTVKASVHGKNLIPYPYANTTKTIYGITFTDNGDGSITIDGTATDTAYFILQKDVEYGGTINAMAVESASNGTYTASKRLYYNAINKMLTVNISAGTTISNETIYPQLEKGAIATEYEPYVDPATIRVRLINKDGDLLDSITPSADGTCEFQSVSQGQPIARVFFDGDQYVVTGEIEYNRDSNKVIADLLALITQNTSSIAFISLLSANWKGTASPYSQVVSVEGITEYSKIDLNPSVEQLAIFHDKDIAFVAENEDGVVTIYCIGQKPTIDYSMQITITEVAING